jgi:pyruvate dehydrogenase E2 component (dihydrolipoamide acetyltransferase)
MAEVIRMPKMSDTMEEGVIASWQVKVGDKVESGDILAEVETDKATMELESYNDGVLLHIGVQEKDAVPVNGVLAIIGEEGEDISDLLKEIESEGQGGGEQKEEKEDKKEAKKETEASEDIDVSDINAIVVAMPKMSDTMQEGTIAAWHKKVGDTVESGDILAEVETDKATMELEAYEDGTLLYVGVEEGDAVPVDAVIAVIGEEGADYEKLLKAHKAKQQGGDGAAESEDASAAEEAPIATAEKRDTVAQPSDKGNSGASDADGRIKASPLAKKLAEEKGYDISQVKGTGEGGRIVRRDIEEYKPQAEAPKQTAAPGAAAPSKEGAGTGYTIPQVVGEERYEDRKVSQMRKTIAKRLAESKFTAPHFYLTMEIDMDKAIEARKSLNEISPVKISFNDLVIKAVAASLRQHPKVNVSWRGDTMRFNEHIHIGVAVAVEEGLLVPVVRFADNKSLSHISAEVKELGQKAKNKQLQPKDWEGSTFTISNLGMFGIEQFTAIVNPPDACILAVGGIKETPVVKNGQLVPGNIMKVTLSCDHRAVDGAVGSAFLQTFKGLLEDPVRILI